MKQIRDLTISLLPCCVGRYTNDSRVFENGLHANRLHLNWEENSKHVLIGTWRLNRNNLIGSELLSQIYTKDVLPNNELFFYYGPDYDMITANFDLCWTKASARRKNMETTNRGKWRGRKETKNSNQGGGLSITKRNLKENGWVLAPANLENIVCMRLGGVISHREMKQPVANGKIDLTRILKQALKSTVERSTDRNQEMKDYHSKIQSNLQYTIP